MVKEFNGDLLTSGCDIIAHQVNLQGVMGGGLALQIARKYPDCESDYKYACEIFKNGLSGKVLFSQINPVIANCFSQNENFTTNYKWLRKCAKDIEWYAKKQKLKTVGMPFKYGCGIATGDWETVYSIFCEVFNKSEIELQIWKI